VLVATPGRLLDLINQKAVSLKALEFFVLDEADRMLDMGFHDDIMKIASHLPAERQTLLFSATMPPKIRELAVTLLHDPVEIKIAVSRPAEKIRQSAYVCYEPQKLKIIKHLFKAGDLQRVIIFSGKKEKVKEVTRQLKQMHINCDQMHSDLSQQERDEVMYRFKASMTDVLVATDIVARGIDIDDIRIVINYDVPHDAEDYVHRIGRTARADRDGQAITFISDTDIYRFQQIEHFLGKEVEKTPLPDGMGEAPVYVKREKKRNDTRRHGRWHSKGNGSKNNQKRKNTHKKHSSDQSGK
jgi:superfamily II DNA/RNA helicase